MSLIHIYLYYYYIVYFYSDKIALIQTIKKLYSKKNYLVNVAVNAAIT